VIIISNSGLTCCIIHHLNSIISNLSRFLQDGSNFGGSSRGYKLNQNNAMQEKKIKNQDSSVYCYGFRFCKAFKRPASRKKRNKKNHFSSKAIILKDSWQLSSPLPKLQHKTMMIPIKSTRWNWKVSTKKVALTRHRIQQLYASLMRQQPTIDCPWNEVLNGVHPKRSPTSIAQASIINFNTQRCLKKACIPQIA